jgi:hypothetical protein
MNDGVEGGLCRHPHQSSERKGRVVQGRFGRPDKSANRSPGGVLKLGDDTVLELYGPADQFDSFFATGPVVAFRVENFESARRAMIEAGVNFIGEAQYAGGAGWQHFHCPDGTILEISGPAAGAPGRGPNS